MLATMPALLLVCAAPQGPARSVQESIRVSLVADPHFESLPGPAVRVIITNLSPRRVLLRGIPAVHLRPVATSAQEPGPSFWAPFDAGTGSALKPNSSSSLDLAPGGSRTLTLKLGALNWGTEFQARWPEQPMTTIPKGRYTLHLELPGPEAAGSSGILRSNEQVVLLGAEEPRPQP